MGIWKDSPQIETEIRKESPIDISIFKKHGNSKTYSGYLIQKIKEARDKGNQELVFLINHFYTKYIEFQKSERIWLDGWKGKSSIKVTEGLDKFIIITFQKEDQDSAPKEVKREITKEEVNHILKVILQLNKGEPIHTRAIGEMAYKKDWDTIFADRYLHTQLNLILRLLDFKDLIKYRGGRSLVLKK